MYVDRKGPEVLSVCVSVCCIRPYHHHLAAEAKNTQDKAIQCGIDASSQDRSRSFHQQVIEYTSAKHSTLEIDVAMLNAKKLTSSRSDDNPKCPVRFVSVAHMFEGIPCSIPCT